ncbi:60S ribosomal protein L24 [Xylographa soralifera]|nr:60S ribosomal protein L24 [Xylographa soralifera]
MRTYEDTFSGDKIYPGKVSFASFLRFPRAFLSLFASYLRLCAKLSNVSQIIIRSFCLSRKIADGITSKLQGKLYVRGDSKIFRFQNGKTESLFLQRKNPRRIAWTTLFRRQHKKGISEEIAKKRTRRTVKQQRGIVGASLDVIKERRAQRPEARAAARQAAIKEGKEKKTAAESKKKMEKAKTAAGAARGQSGAKVSKMGAKGAPSKVSAKTR